VVPRKKGGDNVQLDKRKRRVLRAVIHDYVEAAAPVGSRTIARKHDLGVSSATIRNEMADLEEMGYLEQPHTSAGRRPSDQGYRYYVDRMLELEAPDVEDLERIRELFKLKAKRIDAIVKLTGELIAEATSCLSMVTVPEFRKSFFRSLRVIPVRNNLAVLVLVTDDGLIEHRSLEIPTNLSNSDLERISRALTKRLEGKTVEGIGRTTLRELQSELSQYGELLDYILELLSEQEQGDAGERLMVGGASKLLLQPEFHDIERIQRLLRLLERQRLVQEVLDPETLGKGVVVRIGHENRMEELQECSLVTATYYIGGRPLGRLGVLGPTRMNYSKIIAVVDFISRYLGDTLTRA
jgi:heat-inducible transcriptional repressor